MKIQSIALTNFKSHSETSLTLDRLTVIRGLNAFGKTTVENAIELALTSRCEGTDSGGKGTDGLIRKGHSKATVKLTLDDDGAQRLVQCNLNGTSKNHAIVDPSNEQWPDGSQYADWLKSNREVLSCLINNRFFVDQTPDAQKDILSAILLPKTFAWPDWIMPAANSLALKIDWRLSPFEVIEQAYDAAYKERTAINRDLKNFKMPDGDTSKAASYDDIAAKLNTRKMELESAVAALATVKATHAQAGSVRAAAESRRNEAQARIEREEANATRLGEALLSPAMLKKAQESAKGAAKVAQLEADMNRIAAEVRMEKQKRDQLSKLAGLCPTCQTPITDELIASIAKPVIAEIERLAEQEQVVIAERKKLGDPVAATRQVADHEQAVRDIEAAKGRAGDERRILNDAQTKLDELGNASDSPDWSDAEATIADLRQRVQNGSVLLGEARAAQELVALKLQSTNAKAVLLKKQEAVEKLVRYFGDEIKPELLAGSIGTFVDKMNAVLANWGYICKITMEPYSFALLFSGSEGQEAIELKHLSKSQRYRFATAFQVALAVATGFKFVVIDEGDIFFAEVRRDLFNGLQAALDNDELDQAIILMTDDKESAPTRQQVPDSIFWMLENSSAAGEIPTTTARQLGVK